jgi:quercetin dioxygenase-like cupin family protein
MGRHNGAGAFRRIATERRDLLDSGFPRPPPPRGPTMPFHRFEQFKSRLLTPHLSSGTAPVIEGQYMYFCLVTKQAGTGSELHYHPNELLIFPVSGKLNAVVGKDRRIVGPGTFVHAPAFARHSMRATEDGPVAYLYIKDMTWTVVGLAADEGVPDRAMTIDEVNRKHRKGELANRKKADGPSEAVVEGLHDCYYPIVPSLDAPQSSGLRVNWIEGERLAFGYYEIPAGYVEEAEAQEHEQFLYVLRGKVKATVAGKSKVCGAGDIVHVPRGVTRALEFDGKDFTRYAMVQSTLWLEDRIDGMSDTERADAQRNRKAN